VDGAKKKKNRLKTRETAGGLSAKEESSFRGPSIKTYLGVTLEKKRAAARKRREKGELQLRKIGGRLGQEGVGRIDMENEPSAKKSSPSAGTAAAPEKEKESSIRLGRSE